LVITSLAVLLIVIAPVSFLVRDNDDLVRLVLGRSASLLGQLPLAAVSGRVVRVTDHGLLDGEHRQRHVPDRRLPRCPGRLALPRRPGQRDGGGDTGSRPPGAQETPVR
jgi:hypothetical protein